MMSKDQDLLNHLLQKEGRFLWEDSKMVLEKGWDIMQFPLKKRQAIQKCRWHVRNPNYEKIHKSKYSLQKRRDFAARRRQKAKDGDPEAIKWFENKKKRRHNDYWKNTQFKFKTDKETNDKVTAFIDKQYKIQRDDQFRSRVNGHEHYEEYR